MSAPNGFDLEATIRALRSDLAAAQEARQAAEEDRDSARDRVKSLVLDLSAAVGRYQRAEALAESYRKDVDRLDWIERNHRAVSINWFVIGSQAPAQPISFRAAIDAAIAREPK